MFVVWINDADQRCWPKFARITTKGDLAMAPFSTPFSNAVPTFTPEVWNALLRLRARYQQTADLWSERELAHLQFLRWLAENGRLVEDGGPAAAADVTGSAA
jgi:hypothetical protein